jgi:hypothetical protein
MFPKIDGTGAIAPGAKFGFAQEPISIPLPSALYNSLRPLSQRKHNSFTQASDYLSAMKRCDHSHWLSFGTYGNETSLLESDRL